VRFKTFAYLIVLTLATTTVAQSSGRIAYFHLNRVKPSMAAQFETARKRHWLWHQKMGDTWSFHVWQIVSGEASGTYMVCSFGHTWKEVDESDQRVGGEEDDPSASVEPYLDAEWESYYRYLPDLSLAPKEGFSPSAKLAVIRLLLKPEEVESFMAAQSKIKDALTKEGHSAPIRWYQLVSGGEGPQFLLLADRANWAAYEPPTQKTLDAMVEEAYGKEQGGAILRAVRSAVRSQYLETWQYRSDLSFVPSAK